MDYIEYKSRQKNLKRIEFVVFQFLLSDWLIELDKFYISFIFLGILVLLTYWIGLFFNTRFNKPSGEKFKFNSFLRSYCME